MCKKITNKKVTNKLVSMLQAIAPESPIVDNETGLCVWCGKELPRLPFGNSDRKLSHHKKDCPWIGVRKFLNDKIGR